MLKTIQLNQLHWFGHVQRLEDNRIPKRVLYMNLGTTRLRGGPRKRWQDEVREDGRIVSGEGWQEEVHNGEEWKKPLRTTRNCRMLHVPMGWMNKTILHVQCSMFNFLCDFKVTHDFADDEVGKKFSFYIQVNKVLDYTWTLFTLLHPPTHLDAWIFKSVWNIMIKLHSPIMFSHKLNKNGFNKHYRLI
jgi:hypothetical protein